MEHHDPATAELDAPPFAAANATPAAVSPSSSHPSYAEMITAAIVWDSSQGKTGGSSKRAIAKYIDRVYANLPPSHSALLTHHLKRLKNSGHLVMVKNSYQLAFPATSTATTASPAPSLSGSAPPVTAAAITTTDNPTPKRKVGRPPKPKPDPTQPQPQPQPLAVSQPKINGETQKRRGRPPKLQQQAVHVPMQIQDDYQIVMAPAEVPFDSTGNGTTIQKRRPGRPPKVRADVNAAAPVVVDQPVANGVVKRRPGRPPKSGRPRGRPPKSGLGVMAKTILKRRPGRPPKLGGGVAVGVVSGKRRGRPPKGSGPPKVRRLSGKPLGRPRKNAAVQRNHTSDLEMANADLTRKLELVQSKVRDAVGIIRPYVAHENEALTALEQLEELVASNTAAPPMMAMPMSVVAPPAASAPLSVAMDPLPTGPPTDTVSAPFSVNLPPMTVDVPFSVSSGIDSHNHQPMSWMPSGDAES